MQKSACLLPAIFLTLAVSVGAVTNTQTQAPATPKTTPAARNNVVIELSRQTLVIKTSRDDIAVGAVSFTLYQPAATNAKWLDAIRVNGARPKTSTLF